MPILKIKRDDFVLALTSHFDFSDSDSYLDTETGDILFTGDGVDEDAPEDIDDNPRYLWIESIESEESFRIMEDFVASVSDAKAAARLADALGRPKPFRRFKDALPEGMQMVRTPFQAPNANASAELCSSTSSTTTLSGITKGSGMN